MVIQSGNPGIEVPAINAITANFSQFSKTVPVTSTDWPQFTVLGNSKNNNVEDSQPIKSKITLASKNILIAIFFLLPFVGGILHLALPYDSSIRFQFIYHIKKTMVF